MAEPATYQIVLPPDDDPFSYDIGRLLDDGIVVQRPSNQLINDSLISHNSLISSKLVGKAVKSNINYSNELFTNLIMKFHFNESIRMKWKLIWMAFKYLPVGIGQWTSFGDVGLGENSLRQLKKNEMIKSYISFLIPQRKYIPLHSPKTNRISQREIVDRINIIPQPIQIWCW